MIRKAIEFFTKDIRPQPEPLVFGLEPFSLEVPIPPSYVYLNYNTWLGMCEQERAKDPCYRTRGEPELVDEIGEWCLENLTRWRVYRQWPRENGHVFMALSSWIDVFEFKSKMADWTYYDREPRD